MIADIISKRTATPDQILQAFDALQATDIEFMIGRWRGFEIRTGHGLDGLLEPSGWYGKVFESAEAVHPLMFYGSGKDSLYAVDPMLVPLSAPLPRSSALGYAMKILRPVLQTRLPKARLRMIEYRGRSTATMAYDSKPIFDHFARIDDQRVLGIMDLKGMPGPYAFCLERDNTPMDIRV
ncbi:DUF4334 domain-containing protein [Agrobacterium rubi]|uniref:DUF4334 domain-containing protein n=1 Tax=Agrobacterium rubi TaxID=28099 RepID=UPI0015722E11|nr:DUF4334 domain-containing protein [Agrobacterium rubi]NTF09023.1 DUF4334 domain-containing protein [Agrobacterium rubi]NTF21294.1 DUF4334 domain-containing protein [Agrobacterium rubi]NTF28151.1 DUF4334 domain-containing protein [Agrobacterium rubi]